MRNRIINRNEIITNSGLTVSFETEILLKEIPAVQIKTKSIEVLKIIDEFTNKKVVAFTKNAGIIILWEGDQYDEIGQWTDDDVKAKIASIYNK